MRRTLWAWRTCSIIAGVLWEAPFCWDLGDKSEWPCLQSSTLLPNENIFWNFWGRRGNHSVPDLTSERGHRSLTGPPSFSLVSFSLTAGHHGKAGEIALHAGEWGSLLPLPCPESSNLTCAWELPILSSFPLATSLHLTEVAPI